MTEIKKLEEDIAYLNNTLNRVLLEKVKAISVILEILVETQGPDETSDIKEYKDMQNFIIHRVCEFLESVDD